MKRERSSPDCVTEREVNTVYCKSCFQCGLSINDRFMLSVNGLNWHTTCLKCCVCKNSLDQTCFFRDNNVYCKTDYNRVFGIKCARCAVHLSPSDWIRKAKENVYHLACFVCDSCRRQLSTGEEFSLLENRVLCKQHYLETIEGGTTSNDEATDGEGPQRKNKRVRTTFTDEQINILQTNFRVDSNPDSQDLERIAQSTGLTKRVTQVWFQNSRARQKKHLSSKKHQGMDPSLHDIGGAIPRGIDLHFLYAFRPQSVDPESSSSPDTPMMHMMQSEV